MKVIEVGNYGQKFPMIVRCKMVRDQYGFTYGDEKDFCGSQIEIEKEDVKRHEWFKYPNYSGTDYGFICPVCKRFVVVDKKKLPKNILDSAEEIFLHGEICL
jgi:hypothetical protein